MTTRRSLFAVCSSFFVAAAGLGSDVVAEVTALNSPMRVAVATANGDRGEILQARKVQTLKCGTRRVWLWENGYLHSYSPSAHVEILPDQIRKGDPETWQRLTVQPSTIHA